MTSRLTEEEIGRMGVRALPRRLFLTNGKLEFTLRAIPRLKEEEKQEKKER